MRRPDRRRACAAAIGLAVLAAGGRASAEVLSEDPLAERSVELGVVLRSFAFLFAGDVLEPPYQPKSVDPIGSGLFDARLYFVYRTPSLKLVAHEQLTLLASSGDLAGPLSSLGRGVSPPRWLPLTFRRADGRLSLASDLDWLYGAATLGPVTVTVGRQPVTFGRGRIWRTTDRVSTFSLTEVDTEFKPGADALRVDFSPGARTTLTALAALGELESKDLDAQVSLRGSSFVGRLKQGWDGGELGVTAGFVRYDALLGVDAKLDLGALDVYAEVAATWVTSRSLGTPAKKDAPGVPVMSAVVGATLAPTTKLTITPELFYNGFGSVGAGGYLAVAASERAAAGEQIAFGRFYAGLSSDLAIGGLTHLVGTTVLNLADPSALYSMALSRSLAQNVTLVAGGYVPIGLRPSVPALGPRSEYGSYPFFVFTELKATL